MASNPQVHGMLREMLELGKTPEEVCRDCPELLPEVRQRWRQFQLIDVQVKSLLPGLATRPDAGATAPPGGAPTPPAAFGRYQVRGTLGAGGFGAVYLGHDTQLDRPVAIRGAETGTLLVYPANWIIWELELKRGQGRMASRSLIGRVVVT